MIASPAVVRSSRGPLGAALLVTALSLAVYWRSLAPGVTLVDSGELILAARNLGVAHPPGFPLWVLLGHLATWLPFGSVALRVNASSAVFAALAAGTASLALRELVAGLRGTAARRETRRRKQSPAQAPAPLQAGTPALVASGLLLAFSRTLWAYATVAEVYSLNTLLVAACIALVLHWRQAGRAPAILWAAAAAFGLGLGVHHVTVALTLPALALMVLEARPGRRVLIAATGVAGLVTVLLYATLPLVAARAPVLCWGDPTSLERLYWHVSGRQYQAFVSFSLAGAGREAQAALGRLLRELGTPPLLPLVSLWGFLVLWRRDRLAFGCVALLLAANLAFTSLYSIAEDKDAYQLPALLAVVLAAGVGLVDLTTRLGRRGALARRAGLVAVAALPLVPLLGNFAARDRSRFRVAADYADNVLRSVPEGGLLLTSDWQVYSPLLYVQEVEGRRRDLVAVDVALLRRPWYLAFLRRRFPAALDRVAAEAAAFGEDLLAWERDPLPYDQDPRLNRRINERFQAFVRSLVATQLEHGGACATYEVVVPRASPDPVLARLLFETWTLRPRGIVFELSPERGFTPLPPLDLETRGLGKGPVEVDDVVSAKVRPAYVVLLVSRGRYLEAAGDPEGARQAFEAALALDPDQPLARAGLDQLRLRATKTRSRE